MTLTDDGAEALAALDAWVKASEDRKDYRDSRGRTLSAEHLVMIQTLRDRLDGLLGGDPESIMNEFDRLKMAAERIKAAWQKNEGAT